MRTKQGGDNPLLWSWVERSVWTERMLATLETGPKGGKWYSLIDKVCKQENLESAARSVIRNQGGAGVDGMSTEQLEQKQEKVLAHCQRHLQAGTYQPPPVKRVWIPKLGSKELRPLGIPTVETRVVQTAVRNVIEPIFEHEFAEHSYGFRPGRGAQDALGHVAKLLAQGRVWIVDADIKGYFDNIPQDKLLAAVAAKISDGAVLALLERFLKQGVMENGKGWKPTEQGTPQGAVISPLLANIYLDPLDHKMIQGGWQMVRYADDFIILCESQKEAEQALEAVREWMAGAGLTLHPTKTRIVDASQRGGFEFLGYHFERGYKWAREKSIDKLKETIRLKTRRTDGRSLEVIIQDVNRTVGGWHQYFRHSLLNVLTPINGWVRQRLRTILKKRAKRPGYPLGEDFTTWPNAYFRSLGLYEIRRSPQMKLPINGIDF